MENSQDSKLHFLDYWRVIRVRLGLVILVFLLVVIAAGVATYFLPRKYNSFATIEVEPEMTPVRIFESRNWIAAGQRSKIYPDSVPNHHAERGSLPGY